jgi:uncharacterized SAM-binding protein YcdF (DUF218 family)
VALAAGLAVLLCSAYLLRIPLARGIGRLMLRPMSLERSDVIFVMGGEPELLLPYAVDLWKRGYGREIWCATPLVTERQKAFFDQFGFRRDDEYASRTALERSGVPKGNWRVLPGSISTYTDLTLLKGELERRPAKSVLIVSAPYHSLRIGFVVRKLFARGGAAFRYAYPSTEEYGRTRENPDKVAEAVLHELVSNVVYGARYGL